MAYKRILTIQDISCVGQCSMTVAMPVLSVCGLETCILPTALLSTHTGGFGKPEVVHFDMSGMLRHWRENGITFDAVLVGYLGSVGAVETAREVLDTLVSPGGLRIVDPAMADHGRLYSGLDGHYAAAMEALCRRADIVIPNLTEAAMMAKMPLDQAVSGCYVSQSYVNLMLEKLDMERVVLTGVTWEPHGTGVAVWERGTLTHYSHQKLGGSFHGTGDLFAAAFTGAVAQGKSLTEAVKIGADFTCMAIANTLEAPAHWYGIKFEPILPALAEMVK